MNGLILARALHILAVVIWIGGVSMVTLIVLPSVRSSELGQDRLRALQAIERRFVWHARIAVIVVGVTGFYMTARLDLWPRFQLARFWWMHAMVGLWLIFALVLFLLEPLRGLHSRHDTEQGPASDRVLARLYSGHVALLALAVVTVLGAVAGSHGWWL
jgi:uncharacterized membrane protein